MRARRLTLAAAALLTASLALTGCGGADDIAQSSADKGVAADGKGGESAARGPAADSGYAAQKPAEGQEQGQDKGQTAKKPVAATHVIRTAELVVEVKDATRALASVRTTVETAGGHIANETTERVDDTQVMSRVVLRVPQDRYASVLADLAGSGKLLTRKANAQDVTDQVVDVESRIATQRASVARVRELMDQATQLSDVVTLEGELSRRQAELESLLAQQASLKDRTALATITLELLEQDRDEPVAEEDDPTFLDALKGGWEALVESVRWIGLVLGAVAPFAAVLAVLFAVWRWLIRPWRRRGASATAAPDQAPAAGPAEGPAKGSASGAAPVPAPASAPEQD
ncbi:DUF4349 domain-containing protein [Streptomyces sp. NPDC059909]|uniref:DUF4349 domain-containing protein n=1 Tax=Streptomyces sp. NPDC059909 TaxID=3346998 RepID=UPI0036548FCB